MFKEIDEERYEQVGKAAKLYFIKNFINLFSDLGHSTKEMSYTILDLLFILGNSTAAKTYSEMTKKNEVMWKTPLTEEQKEAWDQLKYKSE